MSIFASSRSVLNLTTSSFLILLLCVCVAGEVNAQQSNTAGGTPSLLTPGAPAGAYALEGFDTVNLFNGNLNFSLPILTIKGRGNVSHIINLRIEQRWQVDGYSAAFGVYVPMAHWWTGIDPGYGPGTMEGRQLNEACGDPVYAGQQMTRLYFTKPDGTEIEFRDQESKGEVKLGICYPGGVYTNTFNRKKVFNSVDGSAATFTSDANIFDWAGAGEQYIFPSGNLMWADGTMYRIVQGMVVWMRDRNGNRLDFGGGVSAYGVITDSLNRQVTITQHPQGGSRYDLISFKGSDGAPRQIKIWYRPLEEVLREDFRVGTPPYTRTYAQLISLPGNNSPTVHNPLRAASVELPNGRSYQFFYNLHGELARVVLPTGGAYEYDWLGYTTGNPDIVRRVSEKRVYPNGGQGAGFSVRTVFTDVQPGSDGNNSWFITEQRDPGNNLLAHSRHYFHGNALWSTILWTPFQNRPFNEGREHKTELFNTSGSSPTSLMRELQRVWTATFWGPAPPSHVRVSEETTRLADTNQVSKQTFGYDQYNNQTDVWEYGFGAGAPGPLMRRKHTTYLTTNPFQSNINYSTDTSIHIRSLPTEVSIYDGNNTEVSRTWFEYDNYSPYSLQDCPGIVQHDGGYHAGYGRRGNLTKTILFASIAPQSQNIYLHNKYDIAGNVVKAVDGRGFAADFYFDDRFGHANGEARSNSGAPELGGQFSYAYRTKAANAHGHETYTQYDYYLGKPVDIEDPNQVKTGYIYNEDSLDRLTKVLRGLPGADTFGPASQQTLAIYNDSDDEVGGRPPHSITTIVDKDVIGESNSGIGIKSLSIYDGLGRVIESRKYEPGATYSTVKTVYDGLGRVAMTSNPYRPGGAVLWTTTEYDALGRIIKMTTPDGARVDTAYNGNQVTVTEQAGKKRRTETDALNRLVKVIEDPDGLHHETFYSYDVLDNLLYVGQGEQGRWFSYDSLSRLIRIRHPEQDINYSLPPHTDPFTGGNGWSTAYSYDANGNLVEKTDARNIKITYGYDPLNRNTTVDYSNTPDNPDITRYFDNPNPGTYGKGRYWHDYAGVAGLNGEHKAIDSYDALGRPLSMRQLFKLNGTWSGGFITSQTYDLAGNIKTQTYPSGRTTSYSYNAAGRLANFSGTLGNGLSRAYATVTQYNPAGQKERESYGVGVSGMTPLYLKLLYNKRHQLVDLKLGSVNDASNMDRGGLQFYYGLIGAAGQNPLADEPNNNGNLVRQWSYVPKPGGGFVTTQLNDYGYDQLNRVTTFTEGQINESGTFVPNVATQNFAYDRYGNRRVTSATGGVSNYNPTYNTWNNRIDGLGYDAAGNVINDPLTGGTMTYDAENRVLTATNGGGASYSYDASGQRVRRATAGQQWWYVYGVGGELVAEYLAGAAPTAVKKEYGYRGGQLLITADSGSTTNLALGKTATQSSTDWGGVASRGVDGATSGNWANNSVTHTTVQSQAWWHVDLGSVQQIGAIKVWNRTDCCGERLSNFFVLVSDTPFASTSLATTINQAGVSSYYVAGPVATATEVAVYRSGRYVRVQLAGSNALSVAEVEVRGGTGIQWLVTDHLGSTRMVIDQTGSLSGIKRHDYASFGEELTAGIRSSGGYGYVGSNLRQKFGSKERDNETGLDYLMARYYSSIQGRFTGVDPLNPQVEFKADADADEEEVEEAQQEFQEYLSQPQHWNRYSYCLNNPQIYTDPDGRVPVLIPLVILGIRAAPAVIAAARWLSSPQGQRTMQQASRYGVQLGNYALTTGRYINTQVFQLGPVLRGRIVEGLRGAPNAFANFPKIDNFSNSFIATSIKSLDVFAKSYQSTGALVSRLTGYVNQLLNWKGGTLPNGMVIRGNSQIAGRVLEVIIPKGNLSQAQINALYQVQQEALKKGVQVVYYQAQ